MLFPFAGLGIAHFLFFYLRVLSGESFPPPLKREKEEALFREMKEGSES